MKSLLLLLLVPLLASCGQHLMVRNYDPTYQKAEILIDDKSVGSVGYMDTLKVAVAPGRYQIKVRYSKVDGSGVATTIDAKHPLDVVIVDDAMLTLLPMPPK